VKKSPRWESMAEKTKTGKTLRAIGWYIAALVFGAVAIFAGYLSFSTNREVGWGLVPSACFAVLAAIFNVVYIALHYLHRADILAALRQVPVPVPPPAAQPQPQAGLL